MVFHFRCFSIGDPVQDPPPNTSFFYTAHSDFDSRAPQSASDLSPQYASGLRAFKLAELVSATRNFDKSLKIGAGGFGDVHMGVIKSLEHPFNEIKVAVKRGKRGRQGRRQWETEVNILGEIKHPNLVKLIGYCNEDLGNESNWLLVYEYMPNGSLDDHLSGKKNEPLSWATRLNIARDAATGLAYLHEGMGVGRQIIFRDFKPSNILLDGEMNALLSDFGFAREGPQDGTHISTMAVGTKGYAAPEYVQTGRLTSKIDVWSYGIFLEELITGRRPVSQNASENINSECFSWLCCYAGSGKSNLIVDPRLQGSYSEKSMQQVGFIANKCLAKEPKLRPVMSEVLEMVNAAIAMQNQHLADGGHD